MTARSNHGRPAAELGEGPLGRVTGAVYWYLVVTLLLNLAAAPGLVALFLLDRSVSNAPLAALCFLPVGPALSAALFALRDRPEAEDMTPARSFWRGYRLNAVDIVRLWAPALLVLAVIAMTLGNLAAVDVPAGYGTVLVVIGAIVALWATHTLVIASFFTFRARDVARLGAHYLLRLPLVTLGTASLLTLAVGVVYVTFDVVLAMLGGVWAGLLLRNDRLLLRDVRERFTHP